MKRIFALLSAVFLLTMLTVYATPPILVDNADLLSVEEESTLLATLEELSAELNMDVVIVTVDSLEGKSARAYADDYFDYNGYGPDGVLLLISMTEREWYISTSGSAITSVTNSEVDRLGDAMVSYLSGGSYMQAFMTFCSKLRVVATQEQSEGDAEKDPMVLAACFLGSAVIALIVVLIMKGQLKSVRSKNAAESYVVNGSFGLTSSRDLFLYQNTTRTLRPQSNGGGGTHMGSSGRSHGGGGGRF